MTLSHNEILFLTLRPQTVATAYLKYRIFKSATYMSNNIISFPFKNLLSADKFKPENVLIGCWT